MGAFRSSPGADMARLSPVEMARSRNAPGADGILAASALFDDPVTGGTGPRNIRTVCAANLARRDRLQP